MHTITVCYEWREGESNSQPLPMKQRCYRYTIPLWPPLGGCALRLALNAQTSTGATNGARELRTLSRCEALTLLLRSSG